MTDERRFPTKRPKPHENGVLAFTDSWEVWSPRPTEGEAQQYFGDFDSSLRSAEREEQVTVRLILRGSVAGERVIPPHVVE
jgi:hypothetical protein